jgi:hypothetical protein
LQSAAAPSGAGGRRSYRANPAELILLKYYANAMVHLFEHAATPGK